MKQLDAGEVALGKIFASGDYDFEIPDYQRPYAWGIEEALELLDDLKESLDRDTDEPYFLGSIVLVKDKGAAHAEVIDGQQRLTTLTILFAVLRDLAGDKQVAEELQRFIAEPGQVWAGTTAKPRLALRERDREFFHKHVQTGGSVNDLVRIPDDMLTTEAQRAVRDNADALRKRLGEWPDDQRTELFKLIGQRTFLVVVSTPDLASAHRIFSVMNARGMDLSPADIFKARVIGDVPSEDRARYADKWEDAEEELGRAGFADLFLHIRMILNRTRARRELLLEFPEQVLSEYLPGHGTEFVDDVLLPYAEAYGYLLRQDLPGESLRPINMWLRRLIQLDNNDWRPPALWALRHHRHDPAYLDAFFRRLERLAASMFIRRVYRTPRLLTYINLLRELDAGTGVDAPSFDLRHIDALETLRVLNGDIYGANKVNRYVLLRLDETLAGQPGATYEHKTITIEHVLPQQVARDSTWARDFSPGQREHWTNRLANLVLLNRYKNSVAQNYDFHTKKEKYFTGPGGSAVFALTTQVLQEDEWTPAVLEKRQKFLLNTLANEWKLDNHGVE